MEQGHGRGVEQGQGSKKGREGNFNLEWCLHERIDILPRGEVETFPIKIFAHEGLSVDAGDPVRTGYTDSEFTVCAGSQGEQ